jgi:site-specific DNA-methyltransferase (adenine-specific)
MTNVMGRAELAGGILGRIHVGDCVSLMERFAGQVYADMIIADPPYNIGYEYDVYQDKKADDDYLQWSELWIRLAAEMLAPGGALWIAIGDEYAAELKCIAHRKVGLHLRNWVIWYYTFGVHCERKFSRSHTHLLYFVKDLRHYKFNADAIRVPSARLSVYRDKRANLNGRVPDNTWILRPQDAPFCFQPSEDTWHIPRVCGTFRERAGFIKCQLPEALLSRIILACSDEGDVVFDPFAGSGSTLVVAKKLGRRFFGCELSQRYAELATQRLQATILADSGLWPGLAQTAAGG